MDTKDNIGAMDWEEFRSWQFESWEAEVRRCERYVSHMHKKGAQFRRFGYDEAIKSCRDDGDRRAIVCSASKFKQIQRLRHWSDTFSGFWN